MGDDLYRQVWAGAGLRGEHVQ